MAWTAPMTAVANTAFTAAQFNIHVRDNLLETAPAKASLSGAYFTVSGTNQIAERRIASNGVSASASRSSTTYGDLSGSFGPSLTVTTGTRAMVFMRTGAFGGTSGSNMSFTVSGATTLSAELERSVGISIAGSVYNRYSGVVWLDALNSGSNTFTAKYRTLTGGTATFIHRHIMVMPF